MEGAVVGAETSVAQVAPLLAKCILCSLVDRPTAELLRSCTLGCTTVRVALYVRHNVLVYTGCLLSEGYLKLSLLSIRSSNIAQHIHAAGNHTPYREGKEQLISYALPQASATTATPDLLTPRLGALVFGWHVLPQDNHRYFEQLEKLAQALASELTKSKDSYLEDVSCFLTGKPKSIRQSRKAVQLKEAAEAHRVPQVALSGDECRSDAAELFAESRPDGDDDANTPAVGIETSGSAEVDVGGTAAGPSTVGPMILQDQDADGLFAGKAKAACGQYLNLSPVTLTFADTKLEQQYPRWFAHQRAAVDAVGFLMVICFDVAFATASPTRLQLSLEKHRMCIVIPAPLTALIFMIFAQKRYVEHRESIVMLVATITSWHTATVMGPAISISMPELLRNFMWFTRLIHVEGLLLLPIAFVVRFWKIVVLQLLCLAFALQAVQPVCLTATALKPFGKCCVGAVAMQVCSTFAVMFLLHCMERRSRSAFIASLASTGIGG